MIFQPLYPIDNQALQQQSYLETCGVVKSRQTGNYFNNNYKICLSKLFRNACQQYGLQPGTHQRMSIDK